VRWTALKQLKESKPLQELLIALSLANLLFLKGWMNLFEGVLHPYFREDTPLYQTPTATLLLDQNAAALVVDVLLLGGAFWAAVQLVRRSQSRLAHRAVHWVFLGTCALFLSLFASVLRRQYPFLKFHTWASWWSEPLLLAAGVGLVLGAAWLLIHFRSFLSSFLRSWLRPSRRTSLLASLRTSCVKSATTLLLILSPFLLVTLYNAARLGLQLTEPLPPAEIIFQPNNASQKRPATRVLWLLFDSLDYRVLFPDRPAGLSLPELDRLRQQALSATQAQPPAPVTGRALPALLSGRAVTKATPLRRDELLVTFANTETPVAWSSQPTLFSQAREAGFSTAVIGWYHPYCRLFRASLTTCSWTPFHATRGETFRLAQSINALARQTTPPGAQMDLLHWLGLETSTKSKQHHIKIYRQTFANALRAITDPRLDLVLIHWPIPHEPYIYNRVQQNFTLTHTSEDGYLDNLVLMDRTLEKIRLALEQAGLAEHTTILLSSDHSWRESNEFDGKQDPRVPFLLKLANSIDATTDTMTDATTHHTTDTATHTTSHTAIHTTIYDQPFDTIRTSNLLLALLEGKLTNLEQVWQWLDRETLDTAR